MSWIKQQGQGNNSPGQGIQQPPVPMYNPNQPQGQGHQWQQPTDNNCYQQKYWPQQDYNSQTGYYQDNYQQNVQYNQQYVNNSMPENDGWNDWNWVDEDNSNTQTITQSQQQQYQHQQQQQQQPPPPPQLPTTQHQQQNLNYNPNLVGDSFANDKTWQWSTEENKDKSKLDNLKRTKLETPQWSVESQVSQESSDDILQSESDKISRSSISQSPISNDISNHNEEPIEGATNKEILQKPCRKYQPKQEPNRVFSYNSQLVNLETLPDNSEQPDPQPAAAAVKINQTNKPIKQWAENNETPINDRNQYLETGQLSDIDNQGSNDVLPPPGLRRMVLGQLEQDSNINNADEPPPGLVRTVLGQIEIENTTTEPLEGLHRMVPGEYSYPESTLKQNRAAAAAADNDNDDVLTARSATIGADTPPINTNQTNRSETVGGDSDYSIGDGDYSSGVGADVNTNNREEVEGQNQDIVSLTNSVRNLNVGDNDNGHNNVEVSRRQSRQESSESEKELRRKSPPRERRRDDRERKRGRKDRYSPDAYRDRDRKHDRRRYDERRYDDDTDYYKDTDYYSDKEKSRRRKEDKYRDEYEKKYSSLRKDKDKERRRRDDRRDYDRDPRKYYKYENNYEEPRSRTSSRSDSVHDHYRERRSDRDRKERRHKEKDRSRRYKDPRDPFGAYVQGFGYDMYSQYYQQYQYYENLRKTNPQAYAQLYRKYYENESHSYGGTEDRASVHSGRSSANDELTKDRYTRQSYYSQTSLPQISGGYYREFSNNLSSQYGLDDSSYSRTFEQNDTSLLNYEDQTVQRLTPAKFITAHLKASISSGKLVKLLPNYPTDGQAPIVEISNFECLLGNNEEYLELKEFPGPLIKGITHKKTIIEYCENKIKGAAFKDEINDMDSYILMWELLILLLRQNGMVVGTDIAELLLKNHPAEPLHRSSSVNSNVSSNIGESDINSLNIESKSSLKEEEITNKFREYLLYGSDKEALEWAMKHGLWGHALFLASKLDKRTYANVMMRFANGLTMNDPLQTLYQLLSGKIPAVVTCVADEKWGDWRPHLAMILSNPSQRPELSCKAITNLGDTLMNRGSLYSAQFCYLMAEVGFSDYGNDGAKLVLLGSNHNNNSFINFATNEAILMTEIYEYACSLNDNNFSIPKFQEFKYILSTRLADMGLLEKSLAYLERISNTIIMNPSAYKPSLIKNIVKLADKLKFYDPVGDIDDDNFDSANLDTSRPDNSWLKELRAVQDDYEVINQQQTYANATSAVDYNQSELWQQQQQQFVQQPQVPTYPQWGGASGEQVQEIVPEQTSLEPQRTSLDGYTNNQYQEQYWPGQQQWNDQQNYTQKSVEETPNYYGGALAQNEDIQQPQISIPNQSKGKNPYDDDPLPSETNHKKEEQQSLAKARTEAKKENKNENNTTWFGLFSRLTLKPKNQMKLPDDKNPTIVWDQDKKRWVNTEEDNGDGENDFKPPPKMSDLTPTAKAPPPPAPINDINRFQSMQINNNNNNPVNLQNVKLSDIDANTPKVSQPNMFKLQKGRTLKKSYIDVFNPNGNPTGKPPLPPGAAPLSNTTPATIQQTSQMNFFVPQPVNDPNAPLNFLTPATAPLQQANEETAQYQN